MTQINVEHKFASRELLLEQFAFAEEDLNNTFSTWSVLKKKIDYVLDPWNDQWKVIETKTICRSDASDHCALLTVLEFKE